VKKGALTFSFRIPTRLLRNLRTLGRTHKPHAHWLVAALLLFASAQQRKGREPVSIPSDLFNMVVGVLLTLPASKRGRRPEASTPELQRLFAQLGSKRAAARAVSNKTGEDFDTLRHRLMRSKPSKPKRKGGT
jgi:hypothetical protein